MMNAEKAREMTITMLKTLEERAKKVAINFAEVACQDAIKFAILKGKCMVSLEVPEDINKSLVIEYLRENGYYADLRGAESIIISWRQGAKAPFSSGRPAIEAGRF